MTRDELLQLIADVQQHKSETADARITRHPSSAVARSSLHVGGLQRCLQLFDSR